MALRWWDGCTGYAVANDLGHRYTVEGAVSNIAIDPNGGVGNVGCVEFGVVSNTPAGLYTTLTSSSELIVGLHFNYKSFNSTIYDRHDSVLILGSGSSSIVKLIVDNTGAIRAEIDGYSILFNSADETTTADGQLHYLAEGSRYRIELRVKRSDTDGEFELRVNGVTWAYFVGADTGNANFTRLTIGTGLDNGDGGGCKYDFCGLYVVDRIGDYANDFFNEWRAQVIRPNYVDPTPQFSIGTATNIPSSPIIITPQTGAIGVDGVAPQVAEPGVEARAPDSASLSMAGYAPTVTMTSRHWDSVDDGPDHDADSTHNYSTSNTQVDRFGSDAELEGEPLVVMGVNVCCIARCDDGQTQKLRTLVKHSSTTTNGTDVTLNQVHYKSVIQTFATCPSTGGQWTKQQVEDALFGYESRA